MKIELMAMFRNTIFSMSNCYMNLSLILVNGGWAAWSAWSGFAKGLCSGNQRVKTRPCTNPMPSTDGEYCTGDNAVNEPGPGMNFLLLCYRPWISLMITTLYVVSFSYIAIRIAEYFRVTFSTTLRRCHTKTIPH